ncbi:ankyrin repeat domain-containing protein [Paraburkholderia sp. SIMBA_055]
MTLFEPYTPAMKIQPVTAGLPAVKSEEDTANCPFDSTPTEVLTHIVGFLDSAQTVGAATLVSRRFADVANKNLSEILKPLLGDQAGPAEAAYFAQDMKDAGSFGHFDDILALLRRPSVQRAPCDLVTTGLITQPQAAAMKPESFENALSDNGIRALARGFATAENIEAFLDDPVRSVFAGNNNCHCREATDKATARLIGKLARAGYDPEVKVGENGVTSLMLAAAGGLFLTVQILLDLEADINARTSNGASALTFAIRSGHVELIRGLVRCGADVNVREPSDISTVKLVTDVTRHKGDWLGFLSLTEDLLNAGVKDVNLADSIPANRLLKSMNRFDLSARLETVTAGQ